MCGQSYAIEDIDVSNVVMFWFERLIADKLLALPGQYVRETIITCPAQSEPPVVDAWANPVEPSTSTRLNRFRLSYGINNWLSIADWKAPGPNFRTPDGIDDWITNKKGFGVPEYPRVWNARYSSEKIILADVQTGFQLYHWLPNTESTTEYGGYPYNSIDWR